MMELLSLGNYEALLDITLDHMGAHLLGFVQQMSFSADEDPMDTEDSACTASHFRTQRSLSFALYFCSNPLDYFLSLGRFIVEFYHYEVDSLMSNPEFEVHAAYVSEHNRLPAGNMFALAVEVSVWMCCFLSLTHQCMSCVYV